MFFIKQELPINRQIKAREVQLIGENGEKLGVISFNEALEKAKSSYGRFADGVKSVSRSGKGE